jgi:GrpB-like predicted nucleotidyltransferase (UPF0157 family)
MTSKVVVVAYDDRWPQWFEAIRARIAPVLDGVAISIEHVGSTSVAGLAAKPIVDIDVVAERRQVSKAIERLGSIGYRHQGDLGVPDREAFRHDCEIAHNLYVCAAESTGLRNHLVLRGALRADSALAQEYGKLKRHLAAQYPDDIDAYVRGKTAFIVRVLAASGAFSDDELRAIRSVN